MPTKKRINYRVLNEELEAILEVLQSGDLDIDDALNKHERGMEIVKELQDYLKQAENKVKKVKKSFNQ